MAFTWKNKNICITGGAGFLGSNLAHRLLKAGARVRLVDNLERGRRDYVQDILPDVEWQEADLREQQSADRAVAGMDVVFHLASQVGGIKVYLDQPGTVLNNNLLIDQHIFAAIVKHRTRNLFYASSGHVYPETRQQTPDAAPLKEVEAYPALPGLSYGWAKLIGERSILGMAQEHDWLRAAMARIVGAYGYNQDIGLATGSVIPVFCHRAIRWPDGAPFRIWGTGKETRSYCFVDDVLDAIIKSVEVQERETTVGPFNLGATGRVSIADIADIVVQISGKKIELEYDPSANTAIWGQAVECDLATQLLDGWAPRIDLPEGIEKTYRHIEERIRSGIM